MKKYFKPKVNKTDIVSISEPMFMYGSSWEDAPDHCYYVRFGQHQIVEEGRPDFRLQGNAYHRANDNHSNYDQTWIFYFTDELPSWVSSVTMNGQTMELKTPERDAARVTPGTWPHNNGYDEIGLGDITISFQYTAGTSAADLNAFIADFGIEKIFVNDVPFRI